MESTKARAKQLIEKYPHRRDDIIGLFELCRTEIEDGESEENEVSLCNNDFDEIEEEEKAKLEKG